MSQFGEIEHRNIAHVAAGEADGTIYQANVFKGYCFKSTPKAEEVVTGRSDIHLKKKLLIMFSEIILSLEEKHRCRMGEL